METYEEERRLFYVGATRAKQDLRLMTTNRKSSFCEELLGKREKTNTRSGKKESVYSSLSNSATGNRKTETDRIIVGQEEMGSPQDIRKREYI